MRMDCVDIAVQLSRNRRTALSPGAESAQKHRRGCFRNPRRWTRSRCQSNLVLMDFNAAVDCVLANSDAHPGRGLDGPAAVELTGAGATRNEQREHSERHSARVEELATHTSSMEQ